MPHTFQKVPAFTLSRLDGTSWQYPLEAGKRHALVVFFETDCPTCALTLPYLNRLAEAIGDEGIVVGVSQDGEPATRKFAERLALRYPVLMDRDLSASKLFDPVAVPAIYLLDQAGKIQRSITGFSKTGLNELAAELARQSGKTPLVIADPHDGAPESKPGCMSRHREPQSDLEAAPTLDLYSKQGPRAGRVELPDDTDLEAYCQQAGFGDPLPVVPPTARRVEEMLAATQLPPGEIIGRIPPNYGLATVEKIAANAVMAGCEPAMMRVLIPLVRAACDEKFNLHGIQATTHFACPLIIINGPVRDDLGFASGSNVFSNVAKANSTLGRAFQLIATNLGGARPAEIDMSTLGNPGKFSYCIAENEEVSPWEPLHAGRGYDAGESALTLFAAEPPRGVSEHTARDGKRVLKTISRTLVTVWSYRICLAHEAMVVLCPEHAATLQRDGFSKADVREFLFDNTGVPLREFADDGGEGTQARGRYEEIMIDSEPSYRKFARPEAIQILVAGGPAGKFSAVIGSWAAGPRGSQMVTYPID